MSLKRTDSGWTWGVSEYEGEFALISALKTGIYQEGPEKVREIISGLHCADGTYERAFYTALLLYEEECRHK